MLGSKVPTDPLDGPELLGVRVRRSGPIEEAFIDLVPGLTVLYGTNGAGKTFVLDGIRRAFEGDGASELHFRCPPGRWPFWKPLTPSVALAARKQQETENSYERLIEDLAFRVGGISYDMPNGKESELRSVVQLALELNADTESLMEAMFEIVGGYRFARVGNALAQVALSDPIDTPVLFGLAQEAFDAANGVSDEERRELLADDAGPDISGGEYDGRETAFVGFGSLRSAVRRAAGIPTPHWFGDIVRLQSSWGAWPQPIIDPDRLPDLRFLAAEVVETVLRSQRLDASPTFVGQMTKSIVDASLGVDSTSIRPTLHGSMGPTEQLLEEVAGAYRVSAEAEGILDRLGSRATEYMGTLVPDPPSLRCSIRPLTEWGSEYPVRWTALDRSGQEVDLAALSAAQRRWAGLAIRLAAGAIAGEAPPIILIDEPEGGLHRHAERHLARGLAELTDLIGARTIAVTHSPALLDQRSARLLHVRRDDQGHTVVDPLEPRFSERLRELGMGPADVLHRCQTALLVEGRHEEVILGRLFGDELARAGVEVFSVRGAKHLRTASDAQLLFRYTDADLLVVVDNEDPWRIADIWRRAREAKGTGADFDEVLREFNRGKKNAEAQFLKEFCAEALHNDRSDRLGVTSLRLSDVTEYLPLRVLAPGVPADATWQDLHERHERVAKGVYFKTWMQQTFDADFSEASLIAAVDAMDSIDLDLIELLDLATKQRGDAHSVGDFTI